MDTNTNKQQFLTTDTSSESDARVQWCLDNLCSVYDSETTQCKIEDGKLVIYGDIIIPDAYMELPIKIDEVYGDVIVENAKRLYYGKLQSLKNFPTIIHGKFDCRMNPELTTLEGGPEIVDGSYWCPGCGLTSLKGLAKHIGGYLLAFGNKIENIDELKTCTIDHTITIDGNPIAMANDPDYMLLEKRGKIDNK